MPWSFPQYPRNQVDKAGRDLVSHEDQLASSALRVVEDWRSAHHFPLSLVQATLRKRAKAIDNGAILAQRIKRMSSIEAKLKRYNTTRLTQMQDIGGCRAVMCSLAHVKQLVDEYRHDDSGKPPGKRGNLRECR